MRIELAILEQPSDDLDGFYGRRMRAERDRLLAASDWTQLPDAPCDAQAWSEYRQALRDFPQSWTPGPVADFPDPPA